MAQADQPVAPAQSDVPVLQSKLRVKIARKLGLARRVDVEDVVVGDGVSSLSYRKEVVRWRSEEEEVGGRRKEARDRNQGVATGNPEQVLDGALKLSSSQGTWFRNEKRETATAILIRV